MDNERRPLRHANEFWDHYGAYVLTPPERGDLIFFTRHGLFPTHIGIVNDKESYIHAPGHDDTRVCIEPIEYFDITAGSTLGRMLFKSNPIGFKAPTIPILKPTYRYHQQLAE